MRNKNKKKITFFASSLAGGGAEGVCVNVANGLALSGWEVTLVVLHTKKQVYQERLVEQVNFVVLNVSNARYSFRSLYYYLKHNDVNKLVVFNYELTVILILIRELTFLKFKIISRNINSLTQKSKHFERNWRSKLLFWLLFKLYKKSDHIVNQCEGMQNDLLTIFPDLKYKSSVIYNAINRDIEIELNNKNIEENYLLCVGRLEKQKAFDYALKAFSLIYKDYDDLKLKVVGKGSLEEPLKELAKELNISDRVEFVGFDQNIAPYYSNARATLLTSLYEGFPNVLVESIAIGTPVVAFDCVSGPSEIIINGKNGYLCNYLDTNDLSKKLKILLNQDIDKHQVVESSRRFGYESIISVWDKLLSSRYV